MCLTNLESLPYRGNSKVLITRELQPGVDWRIAQGELGATVVHCTSNPLHWIQGGISWT